MVAASLLVFSIQNTLLQTLFYFYPVEAELVQLEMSLAQQASSDYTGLILK